MCRPLIRTRCAGCIFIRPEWLLRLLHHFNKSICRLLTHNFCASFIFAGTPNAHICRSFELRLVCGIPCARRQFARVGLARRGGDLMGSARHQRCRSHYCRALGARHGRRICTAQSWPASICLIRRVRACVGHRIGPDAVQLAQV